MYPAGTLVTSGRAWMKENLRVGCGLSKAQSLPGTWAKLLARAQADADAAGELDRLVATDSTLVRVHQH